MRYFVRFAYNGTDFHGSQTQPNGITVQETMEKAFSTVLRVPVALTFAGRTDAGVHATQMYAHFDLSSDSTEGTDPQKVSFFAEKLHVGSVPYVRKPDAISLSRRLNSLLPSSIAISGIFPVPDDAHARFSATSRRYEYRITTVKDPFAVNRRARIAPGLDYDAMNEAAKILLGRHDFASFCKVHTDVKTTFCTVTRAEWQVVENGVEATFTIAADRFLRNMVRAIVGTLFEVGRHKISLDQFRDIISQHNRCAAGQSAPAEGLYLVEVLYPIIGSEANSNEVNSSNFSCD